MAIIEAIPHFEVQVKVGDRVANEWPMPADDTNVSGTPSIKTYIESETGSRMAVKITLSAGYELPQGTDRLGVRLMVDGEHWRTVMMKVKNHGWTETLGPRNRKVDGVYKTQYPVFTNIISDEEADLATVEADKLLVKQLGQIEIILSAQKALYYFDHEKADNLGQVHRSEVSTKAMIASGDHLSHRICPEEVSVQEGYRPRQSLECTWYEDIAKYHFQYSSHRPTIGEQGFALPAALSPPGTPGLLPRNSYPERQLPGGIPWIDLTQEED